MTDALTVLAFAVGLAAVCAGAWMIYRPAGIITLGVMLTGLAVMYTRGSE